LCGLASSPGEIAICNGAQHAILTTLTALVRPGDTVLTEALTYPGVKTLAGIMGLRLEPVAMDEEGLIPEALDAACRRRKARGLYCMPTLHNPTTVTLSEARRRKIAEIAAIHDLFIIEDDIYRLLPPEAPPPIATFARERTFYIPGVSKTLAGGLRIAYIAAPPKYLEALTRGIAATTWLAPPLTAEIASIWIEDGTALRTLERKREEAGRRWEIAARILGPRLTRPAPAAYHLWLELPSSWRSSQFADESGRAGVSVLPAELFTVGHAQAPQAVRVSLTAARDGADLAEGLRRLVELLDRPPEPTPFIL
jgi:DNA-binding transcriptional MocR family regulator